MVCFAPSFANSGGAGSRGIAKLAVAALAAADGSPADACASVGGAAGEAAENNASLGGELGLDGITVATPVGGEPLAVLGLSGGDGVGGVPGTSEEREGQDGWSQSSAGTGQEDGGGDASVASNARSRASSLANLSRRTSEAGVAVSEREREGSRSKHGTENAWLFFFSVHLIFLS